MTALSPLTVHKPQSPSFSIASMATLTPLRPDTIDKTHSSITQDKHESLPFVIDPLELDPIRFSYFGVLSAAKEDKGGELYDSQGIEEQVDDSTNKDDNAKTTVLLNPVVNHNRFTLRPLRSFDRTLKSSKEPEEKEQSSDTSDQISWLDTDNADDELDQETEDNIPQSEELENDMGLPDRADEADKLMYMDNQSQSSLHHFLTRPDSETVARMTNDASFLHDEDDTDGDSEFEVCIAAVATIPTPEGSIFPRVKTVDEESYIEASDSDTSSELGTLVAEDTRPSSHVQQIIYMPTIDDVPIISHLSPPPRRSPVTSAPIPPRSPFREGIAELDRNESHDVVEVGPSDFENEVARAAALERLKDEEEAAFQVKEREDEERWLRELRKAQADAILEREKEVAATAMSTNFATKEVQAPSAASMEVSTVARDPIKQALKVPRHPIMSMQDAFAESMVEATESSINDNEILVPQSAEARRDALLAWDGAQNLQLTKWRQKPGQKCHELWKLIAQISFGSYLLFDGMARSNVEVLELLRSHITEIDEFVEITAQDLDLANTDITERLTCLKVPMENMLVFDQMLLDYEFRASIDAANEKVDHVIMCSTFAMNDALKNIQHGLSASKEFVQWLKVVQRSPKWLPDRPDIQQVYDGMSGNADGWHNAFISLQTKANQLGIALVQLGAIVAEMNRRVAELNRKMRYSMESRNSSTMLAPASPPLSPPGINISHFSKSSTETSLESYCSQTRDTGNLTLPAHRYVAESDRTPPAEEGGKIPILEQETEVEPVVLTLQPRVYSPAQRSPVKAAKAVSVVADNLNIPEKARRILGQDASTQKAGNPYKPPTLRQRSEPMSTLQLTLPKTSTGGDRTSRLRQVLDARPASSLHNGRDQQISATTRVPARQGNYSSSGIELVPHTSNTTGLAPSPSNQSLISTSPRVVDISFFPAPPGISASRPGSPFVSSPKSDQQHFRPVMANPNSPLQRPWTAGPTQQHNENSYFGAHPPLRNQKLDQAYNTQLNSRAPTRVPSPMRQSGMPPPSHPYTGQTLSESHAHTINNSNSSDREAYQAGQKVKKKKSGFGWLKKAFSLTEEEKAEFEERKKRAAMIDGGGRIAGDTYSTRSGYNGYANSVYERQAPKFLDGRRIG